MDFPPRFDLTHRHRVAKDHIISCERAGLLLGPPVFPKEVKLTNKDEPVKVEPPAWLNAAPSGCGGHITIVDNQIPKVLFYEEGGSVSAQEGGFPG